MDQAQGTILNGQSFSTETGRISFLPFLAVCSLSEDREMVACSDGRFSARTDRTMPYINVKDWRPCPRADTRSQP